MSLEEIDLTDLTTAVANLAAAAEAWQKLNGTDIVDKLKQTSLGVLRETDKALAEQAAPPARPRHRK